MGYARRMNLYLLRHGIAVEREEMPQEGDEARPLTPKGRRQLRRVAGALRQMDVKPDVVFASPLVRAQQTAEVMVKQLKLRKPAKLSYELRPGGSPEKFVRQLTALKPAPSEVLVVGHEPDLSELLSLLVAGNLTAGFVLKKGGIACVETDRLRPGQCGNLAWLITPAQAKLIE